MTRRLKVTFYQLVATQTSSTFLHGTCTKSEPQTTQNVQSQTARISDVAARDSKGSLGREGAMTRLEERSHHHYLPTPQTWFSHFRPTSMSPWAYILGKVKTTAVRMPGLSFWDFWSPPGREGGGDMKP